MATIPFGVWITHDNTVYDFTPSFEVFPQCFLICFKMKPTNEQFSILFRVTVTTSILQIINIYIHVKAF